MPKHIENLARRLETDPFFLACPLKLYARSEGLTEEQLAVRLKCTTTALAQVRLCRAPAWKGEAFHEDIERIATRFSVDANVLAEAIRRGQAIFQMTEAGEASPTLLAARDNDLRKGADQKRREKP
jgi:hypothetical protein